VSESLAGGRITPPAVQHAPLPPARRSTRSLLDIFAATVAEHGGRLAIDTGDAALTYTELAAAVQRLADRLRAEGIGAGDRVGIYVPSGTAELYTAILGVLHAGAAYVPVDADDPPARAASIWADAGACAVIQAGLELTLLDAPAGGRARAGEPAALDLGDDAWIIFTSGSSGRPKGVAVTHAAAAAFVDAEADLWELGPEDRVLAGLSVSFDASCEEMWLAWRHGAALVPAPRSLMRAAADLGPWLASRAITVISTVPTLAAMWSEEDLAGVRLLILGGEACPEPLAWRLSAAREVWNTYGPTEATVVSTAARLVPGEPVLIGWPLAGWQIAIVDDSGRPVSLGEPGELVIAGAGLGRYLDADLDGERYAPLPALGWSRAYRTGDMVRETIEGLVFLGRRDDQVKLGGRRLELGEVDAHLRAVPGVKAGAAAVRKTQSGNSLLVGYVVGDVDPDHVRAALAERLPNGVAPLVVLLDELPTSHAGKVDRKALPWPPPATPGTGAPLEGTAAWLAERWGEELGPYPVELGSDFFDLGGSSLSAAKLVSKLRERYPSLAVADVYRHRRLGALAAHLDALGAREQDDAPDHVPGAHRWDVVHLLGVVVLLACSTPQWLLGILVLDRLGGVRFGPQVGWGWLIAGLLVFGTPLGRGAIVLVARRVLLPTLRPGRYPRHSWLMCRLWFLDRLAESFRSEALAGTPFAARYARLCGHAVGAGARLGTLPPVTSRLRIGAGATLESDVDAHGWWLEGGEVVIGELSIGAHARVGTRTLLGPGAEIGAGAEVEPGSVITGRVAPGERWAGSPGRCVGRAGEAWPQQEPPAPARANFWRAMFLAGLGFESILALAAGVPALLYLLLSGAGHSAGSLVGRMVVLAPLLSLSYMLTYAVLVALTVRRVNRMITPGWHADEGRTGWALWFAESLMAGARGVLFSLFSSIYTRAWLRMAGIPVERGVEMSTAVGLTRLTSFQAGSFAADDVVLAGARARGGWLHVGAIETGRGTFLGNGAILAGDTQLGRDGVIGVQTVSPQHTPDGTAWFGCPAIEFPRVPDRADPARTTHPPTRLKLARASMDAIRILLPPSLSVVLSALLLDAVEAAGRHGGALAMALVTVPALLAAGVVATLVTIAAKWLIMGRYRAGEHPLWSFFVWRDEIMNSLQDQLAGTWLLDLVLGTSLMSVYLRAMGSKVGRDVWCETMTITEFDMVSLGDGCVINRFATIETHLFHDRLMRIGPTELGPGCSIGPATAVLPDTVIGARTQVGGRSVVLRGEQLPPGTRWHGAPVVGA